MPNQNHHVESALEALKKDFIVVGKTRVRSWHAWLAIGIAVGITVGIVSVANRSGEFEEGMAALNTPPIGYLNPADANGNINDWALDPDAPLQSIDVHFYIDGQASANFVAVVKADIPRPDVNDVTKYSGNHGFTFSIPNKYRDAKPHTLYAYGIDTAGGYNPLLIGSPQSFTITVPMNNKPIGYLDSFPASSGFATGWTLDPDVPSQSIDVHFYIDGTASINFAGAVKAAIPRQDVNDVTKYSGDHGFNFPIPAKYRDGKPHTLYAYGIDTAGGTNPKLLDAITGLPIKSFIVNPSVIGPPSPPLPVGFPAGWDYNLSKRCVKSVDSSVANYYQDATDCGTQGKKWTVAVQSEKSLGVSSVGPVNQSFPINKSGSPLSMQWVPHTDELGRKNYSVNLKTDFVNTTHPGGAGNWTWTVLMDHKGHNGGPLPRPDQLTFSSMVSYNDFTPNGASRALAGWQGSWDGKSHAIEINFVLTNWGDSHPDPDIINVINTSTLEFVAMDGVALGITIPKNTNKKLEINWGKIIQNLISRGLIKAPAGGWSSDSVTEAVFIGTETHNWTKTQSVVADMWLTDFRTESTVPINNKPIGYLDSINTNGIISGWTLDPDTPSQSIDTHFYIDGQGPLNFAGLVKAALPRPDVNDVTKYPGDHGFNFQIPSYYRNGKTHTLYAYGIDTAGGTNPLLIGSPKSFILSAP